MKLKGNSTNILQMVLEETKGGKERREKASKEKNDSLHVKCAKQPKGNCNNSSRNP